MVISYVCIDIDQTHCNISFCPYWYTLLKMVSQTETCQGWKIKKERKKKRFMSHTGRSWLTFCNIASVTDQDEPNQIRFIAQK
jgi:hypothetical protein